ncbi:MAG TPA: nodulation protein NfeD [Bryobacteraceae bacterium]|nr:nodulation protein NfeD [Bryobacteraceae bacterium]
MTTEIVSSVLEQAKRKGAVAVILELNTPGGLMDAMRGTIEKIVASPIPVIAYVAPSGARSASAGFFILESGDIAAMAPGTNTGAAHPVALGGQMDAIEREKVENDAAAYMRSIGSKRGRNTTLAESAVRESKSFTEREALDAHLIDLIAPSEHALLEDLDGREITRFDGSKEILRTGGAVIEQYRESLRQRIISAIADPNLALVLLVLGALGIYVEFTSPGLIVPGVAGAILLLLGLSALSVMPINWLGAALLVVALAAFVLEAKFGAHGVLALFGAIAMVLGAMTLVNGPIPEMRIHWETALALAVPFSLITVFLLSLAVRARRGKVVTGPRAMIGETGSAVTALSPDGKVFVHGEYWDAVSREPVSAGARVRITGVYNLKLAVEPVAGRKGGSE